MPQSQYRARQVAAKTHEVVDYDHDDSKPGKPLHILIPGGLVALVILGVIIFIAYATWFEGRLTQETGLGLILLLTPFYIGSVFLFSYGYELYDIPRALRLTAIIVFLTAAAVVILAVLFAVLSIDKKGKSTGGASKALAKVIPSLPSSSGGNVHFPYVGNTVVLGGGRTHTREVTREVVKEVEVPVVPRTIDCQFCHRSYVPAEQNYACPACGAATPVELIEESQEPKFRGSES